MLHTESNRGYVYFIQSEVGGHIKIGSAMNISRRLKQIQTGNPEKLILLHSTTGGKRLEYYLHEKFKPYNKLNEWFNSNGELEGFIFKLKCEDDIYGQILSLKDFVLKSKYDVSYSELDTIVALSRGASFQRNSDDIDVKIKYWYILDEYLEYQKKFPRKIIRERLFHCTIYEGRSEADMVIRKKRNVQLKNF